MAVPMMIASTVVSAVGAIRAGQAQAGAADYNAQIAQQNSTIALQQGDAAVAQQQREQSRRQGSAIALFGASGVDGGQGSAADVLSDNARQMTLDNLTTSYNYKLRAQGFSNQAELDKSNAANSSTAGYLNAIGGAAQGGSRAYFMSQGGGSSIPAFGGY